MNLCIHGHFYQPPRENPWTGEIEKQESAAPYHDWNERIFKECYKPNAEDKNYQRISFDFGPTLLEWLKSKHPDTYWEIINSDHGNAIAMCYNHMIMPLANRNDKVTQVKWAKEDFRLRFGRETEGMWLPETACDPDTLEVLIVEGIKFTILDSSQAESVRQSSDSEWTSVSDGGINILYPYLYRSQNNPEEYIIIFFYDGYISRAISFEDLLYYPSALMDKIQSALTQDNGKDLLISLATDGETFGHHKKGAEKSLSQLLTEIASSKGMNISNYGEFLESHPAEFEVRIKEGEGTSWSCPHGVKRWKEDCGCGGGGEWNQQWRKPLRDSLDWLRDELIEVFVSEGGKYFEDVWKARNGYVNLILDNSPELAVKFFGENANHILSNTEMNICYKLLEMQKYAMFMFTSCGWFFSEISGIETVKVLEYAARAIEIAEGVTARAYEEEFVSKLSQAKSNIPEFRDGKGVWEKLVKKSKLHPL